MVGARLARRGPRDWIAGAVCLALGVGFASARFAEVRRLPTDVLEASFALEWRQRIERSAAVASVERAGNQVTILPLYDGITAGRVPISASGELLRLSELPRPAYYYRSSLCATPEGRPACETLERGAPLELIDDRRLAAHPSMRWTRYEGGEVRVTLFRVR
jgi:hypothetical protein